MADVLVVAGEPSGDLHVSVLVRELKARHPNLSVCAVGGSNLQKAGAHLLFNMMSLSVVGLAEVLKHYGTFVRLLKWLVRWVRVYQPKVICLVDFPGFNLRFAQALYRAGLSKKAGGSTYIYGYIAPQIWAWKARRRFKIARWFDAFGVIFPFEVDCFADTKLKVNFVGHPLLQQPNPFRYDPNGPLLLLPGSRLGAVTRIFPLLKEAFGYLKKDRPSLRAVAPFPNDNVGSYTKKNLSTDIITCPLSELDVGVCGALMSSGTASLQVALAGIPGAVAYRAHPMTFFFGKRLVKVPYLTMANVLLKEEFYPEILQDTSLQATVVAQRMATFLDDPQKARVRFENGEQRLTEMLSTPPKHSAIEDLECLLGLGNG
jgi:lipid-A-disaccharide synthase